MGRAVELSALREGLLLFISIGLQLVAVEVELDATAVIFLVSSNFDLFGDLSAFVDDCRDLLVQIKSLILDCFTATEELGVSFDSYFRFVSPSNCYSPVAF